MQDNSTPRPDYPAAQDAGTVAAASTASASDPLMKAAGAVELALVQTANSPAARATQIAAIKTAYLQEKYGMTR